jgi:cytochrome c oxidase subunit 4
MRSTPSPSWGLYTRIYVLLILLAAMTTTIAFMDLGRLNLILAMTIACAKALAVIVYFMETRSSPRVTWIFVAAGFFWLAILFVLTMNDVLTRGWLGSTGGG